MSPTPAEVSRDTRLRHPTAARTAAGTAAADSIERSEDSMSIHVTGLFDAVQQIVKRDPRYTCEAYEFVFRALRHTQELLGRVPRVEFGGPGQPAHVSPAESARCHVSGPELLDGIRDLALREYGLMARTVFKMWGVNRTDDFGDIVFNLIEADQMNKTEDDSRHDFHNVYDLDDALVRAYRIELDPAE